MRLQRAGNGARTAIQKNRDLALQIKAGKLVDMHLGYDQPMTDEHRGSIHMRRQIGPQAERCILAQRKRP